MAKVKKTKISGKDIIKHLKGDIKGFVSERIKLKKEIKEDKALVKKIKKAK